MKRSFRFFLPLLLLILMLLPLTASASQALTDGVSLMNPESHVNGPGYAWDNITKTLTLNNLNVSTKDDYGFKLPDGATVIIKGKNTVKASMAALYVSGDVLFRGDGSLTLIGGQYGILCHSTKSDHKFTVTGGTYTITGGVDGIHSEFQKVALSGGTITVTGTEGYAINVRDFSATNNVNLRAYGSIRSSYSMYLLGANLTVESQQSALIADKYCKMENMSLRAGDSLSALFDVETYTDQKALSTVSTFNESRRSILFGESVPFFVDVLVLILVLGALATIVIVPPLYKKKKARLVMVARDEAEKEKRQQAKKSRKALDP